MDERTKKTRTTAERGAALVIALLLMGLLLLLGTAFMTISSTETQIAFNEQKAVQAFYLAEAGFHKTISDLNAGAVCSSLNDVPLPQSNPIGTFTRTVTLGASLDQRIVESTGYVPDATSATKAQATVKVTLKGSLFNTALFAQGTDTTGAPELDIGENSLVDSYDSSRGAYGESNRGEKAEIGSNGNIRLKSGAIVKCSAFKRVSINKESGATVTGVETLFLNPVTLPPVVVPPGSGSDVNVPPMTTLTPGSYGKLNVAANKTITFSPGTYYFYGDIKMEPNSTLTISPPGQVKMYVTGKLDVKENVQINAASARPTYLLIYSTGGTVDFDRNVEFHGAIYAPNANITVDELDSRTEANAGIYGSLIGDKINIKKNQKIHFDTALLKLAPCDTAPSSSPPCPYKPVAGTWQEVLPSS